MLEKKHIVIFGLLAFGVIVYMNTNKKFSVTEVEEPTEKKSFDSSSLPLTLMPPTKLLEGEALPINTVKKNFSSVFNLKPRLDRKPNNFL
jgi:hypothetical protein